MPAVMIVLYAEGNVAPILEWYGHRKTPAKVVDKCVALIARLAEFGREVRRPTGDYLRDDIYELRTDHQNVEYRVLYFFDGPTIAVVSHAIVKPGAKVPSREIDLAIERRARYLRDRTAHTYVEPDPPAADDEPFTNDRAIRRKDERDG